MTSEDLSNMYTRRARARPAPTNGDATHLNYHPDGTKIVHLLHQIHTLQLNAPNPTKYDLNHIPKTKTLLYYAQACELQYTVSRQSMTDLLTTKELQAILNIDRTTIYRMAESGRVPAVKVGNQWRFPKQQIETWLQRQSVALLPAGEPSAAGNGDSLQLFPLECVQLIQDSFADALGVMILVTDLNGVPVHEA